MTSKNKPKKDIAGCNTTSNKAPEVSQGVKNVTDGMTDHVNSNALCDV